VILRANQQGVRIHVWLVASPAISTPPELPSCESWLKGQVESIWHSPALKIFPSEVYLDRPPAYIQLVYESEISSGGTHRLEIQLEDASVPGMVAEVTALTWHYSRLIQR